MESRMTAHAVRTQPVIAALTILISNLPARHLFNRIRLSGIAFIVVVSLRSSVNRNSHKTHSAPNHISSQNVT